MIGLYIFNCIVSIFRMYILNDHYDMSSLKTNWSISMYIFKLLANILNIFVFIC